MGVDVANLDDVVHPLLPPLHDVQSLQQLGIAGFQDLEVVAHLLSESHPVLGQGLPWNLGDLLLE